MSNEGNELTEFESALRALKPAASTVNRDRLMFEAGRASAKTRSGRGVHAATTLAIAVLAMMAGWQLGRFDHAGSMAPVARLKSDAVKTANHRISATTRTRAAPSPPSSPIESSHSRTSLPPSQVEYDRWSYANLRQIKSWEDFEVDIPPSGPERETWTAPTYREMMDELINRSDLNSQGASS